MALKFKKIKNRENFCDFEDMNCLDLDIDTMIESMKSFNIEEGLGGLLDTKFSIADDMPKRYEKLRRLYNAEYHLMNFDQINSYDEDIAFEGVLDTDLVAKILSRTLDLSPFFDITSVMDEALKK